MTVAYIFWIILTLADVSAKQANTQFSMPQQNVLYSQSKLLLIALRLHIQQYKSHFQLFKCPLISPKKIDEFLNGRTLLVINKEITCSSYYLWQQMQGMSADILHFPLTLAFAFNFLLWCSSQNYGSQITFNNVFFVWIQQVHAISVNTCNKYA